MTHNSMLHTISHLLKRKASRLAVSKETEVRFKFTIQRKTDCLADLEVSILSKWSIELLAIIKQSYTLCMEQFIQSDSLSSEISNVKSILLSAHESNEQSHIMSLSAFRHKCDYCGKCFPGPALLNQHLRVHTGERPFVCNVCNKAFNQLENLKVHNRVHTGERPFKCHVCLKTFTTKGNLKIHTKVHTGERPFKCQLCDFSSIQLASLKKHVLSKHPT